MFDVGFSELVLIAVLALVVLGPKRLPEVARAAGKWLGKLRRFMADVKQDFDRELNTAELAELRKLKEELHGTRRQIEESSNQLYNTIAQHTTPEDAPAAPAAAPPLPAEGAGKKPAPSPPAAAAPRKRVTRKRKTNGGTGKA